MNYPLGFIPRSVKEADAAIYHTQVRQASVESFIRTIDPYSVRFSEIMQDLFDLRDEIERLGHLRGKLNYIEIGEEIRQRT